MVESPLSRRALLPWLLSWLLLGGVQAGQAADFGNFTLGGDLAVTSDYIYRGVSESNGHAAVQADLHAESGASFFGAWSSTRDHTLDPYAGYDLELYVGHHFELSSAWGAILTARSHYSIGGAQQEGSADYQEVLGALSYLDVWTVSVGAIPNGVHYWFDTRVGRSPAWFGETSGQWLVLDSGFFVTAGAGYYSVNGTGSGIRAGGAYAYANAGVAFEHRRWRVDVGYFLAQSTARRLLPYPIPSDRFAGTLSWRF